MISIDCRKCENLQNECCKIYGPDANTASEACIKDKLMNAVPKNYDAGWNEGLEKLDAIITEQYDRSNNKAESMTLRWVLDQISQLIQM